MPTYVPKYFTGRENFTNAIITISFFFQVSEASDVWALGLILYQMLFGTHFSPFDLNRINQELLIQRQLEAFMMIYNELTSFRIFITGRILGIIESQNQADQEIIAQLIEVIAVFQFPKFGY